uniref:Uncharacterized protein n=1 Tax=Siphoviridae sp. ctrpM6 TaxID=2827956 RepID=A0A8S5T453_9CAUD|nr:MAG TPA: hypothetical protein [Siphoviridae sp. ctrpM6]
MTVIAYGSISRRHFFLPINIIFPASGKRCTDMAAA